MVIYYFGADDTWENLLNKGFRRRNTCILKALAENPEVEKIFLVRQTIRGNLLKNILEKNNDTHSKVVDVFFANLLPAKYFKKLDLFLNNLMIYYQTKRKNKGSDILWSYWPKGFFEAEHSGLNGTRIFDADHNIVDDLNLDSSDASKRINDLLYIGKKSHYILSSTRSMIRWYEGKTLSTFYRLRNGVDPTRFSFQTQRQSKVIGYVGTLSKWIDYDLFEGLIQLNKDKKFIIVGKPYLSDGYKQLMNYENVYYAGEKTEKEVAELLPTFTLSLNVYKKHQALDVDSMKLYEYIAANVPVVCTEYHDDLKEDFEELLFLGNTIEELQKHINTLFTNDFNILNPNVASFVKDATWQNRVSTFLETLKRDQKV